MNILIPILLVSVALFLIGLRLQRDEKKRRLERKKL